MRRLKNFSPLGEKDFGYKFCNNHVDYCPKPAPRAELYYAFCWPRGLIDLYKIRGNSLKKLFPQMVMKHIFSGCYSDP